MNRFKTNSPDIQRILDQENQEEEDRLRYLDEVASVQAKGELTFDELIINHDHEPDQPLIKLG